MLRGEIGESGVLAVWVLVSFALWTLVVVVVGTIMRNSSDVQHRRSGSNGLRGGSSSGNNGFLPSSFRALSSYLRIVSSGASTVAKSAATVAQSIVDRDDDTKHDQVLWAGFDKLEHANNAIRQVLLLGYRSGFQVWDVEDADNVRDLVSKRDGPVGFMQMLPKPIASTADKLGDVRPLLVVCGDATYSGGNSAHDEAAAPFNGSIPNHHQKGMDSFVPTVVRFYSLSSQSYVHVLKFRSAVYSVRCSSRIVAISQAAQIHCFDATTLEREYNILTNPIVTVSPGSGGMGYGPLAVGPRWLAYSGSQVAVSDSGRVSPQHLTVSASLPQNGSLVARYAMESSKQLAAGIVTLGDMGVKKLSRYYPELLPDSNGLGNPGLKSNGAINGHLPDVENIGMVIVKDIVDKHVITQFRAHKSPISALCFDPSGTLLVTASVMGHNINIFKIMPGNSSSASYLHLYRLQRGITNAVIQDISFSDDSNWIMVSSSRGTSHLFAINPTGGPVNFQVSDIAKNGGGFGVMTASATHWSPSFASQVGNQQSICASGPPMTLSAISRIRNGANGWRGTVTGAAAAATGRSISASGAIASSFHNCKRKNGFYMDATSWKPKYHLLVFSPSGCMVQYALRLSADADSSTIITGLNSNYEPTLESDEKVAVEAIQKWNIGQKQNRREREDNVDIYGENGNPETSKIYPEDTRTLNGSHPKDSAANVKGKVCPEERHHLYISEAELQTHQARIPLWVKPGIYFHSMVTEGILTNEEESEVERIPTRMIEARSKDLIPVFDYLQSPRSRLSRIPSVDSNINGRLQHQRSTVSENGRHSRRSGCESLEAVVNHDAAVEEFPNGRREHMGTNGIVNNSDDPETNTQHEAVNSKESFTMDAPLMFVNSNEGLKMESHFEGEGREFN